MEARAWRCVPRPSCAAAVFCSAGERDTVVGPGHWPAHIGRVWRILSHQPWCVVRRSPVAVFVHFGYLWICCQYMVPEVGWVELGEVHRGLLAPLSWALLLCGHLPELRRY